MKYCGGTSSGPKLFLCVPKIIVLDHRCTYEGRLPDESRVVAIQKWGPCKNLSEVRAFLRTIGVVQIFICDFALRANPLIKLTHKDAPFEFSSDQIKAQEDLKTALIEPPTLCTIPLTCYTCRQHVLYCCWIPPLPMRRHQSLQIILQSIP